MKRSLDGGWAGYGTMIVWLILFGYLMSACAGISLKEPITQIVVQDLAQTTGYFIGKDNPGLAKEMIAHDSKADKEDVLAYWPSWKNYLTYRIKDDFLKMKVNNLLKNVDIELGLKVEPSEQIEIIKSILEGFISGLEVGIKQ